MKKKVKKKANQKQETKLVLGRRKTLTSPGKVGGISDTAKLDWGKLGRRKIDTDDTLTKMGAALKSIRERKGVSIGKLAKQLDVAPATIIKFENRGNPISIMVVNAMAKELGCRLDLVEIEPPASKKK